jgi:TatD DNase family protein
VAAWFDSHCHIQDRYLAPEGRPEQDPPPGDGGGEEALDRALAACAGAGVTRLVCVGTDPESSLQALAVAERSSPSASDPGLSGPGLSGSGDGAVEIWATAGLHPHDAATGGSGGADTAGVAGVRRMVERHALAAAAGRPPRRLVAVGECGLDYHYEHSPRAAQRQVFADQIQIAHEFEMALVIHAREAWSDLFDILVAERVPERAVVHCFTGGAEEARRVLDLGMWISFSGIVTFKNADDVRAAASLCPLERLLVETDSPFLAPVPHRGRPNQPALVPLVGQAVAAVKDLDPQEVAATSWAAAGRVFGL